MFKTEITKDKLFHVAMKMISKKGFEGTTMRAVAAEAGVAPGAAYYYFDSKESFVYEYYKLSHEDHEKALEGFFEKEKSFSKRLHKAIFSKIETALPYKNMARALYRVAANPQSPLSPFSPESKALRLRALTVFEGVMEGSDKTFSPEIQRVLPRFMWMYEMGIILYWIYDESKHSRKTFELIDQTVPLIVSASELIQSPFAGPFRKKIISLFEKFAPDLNRNEEKP